MSDLKKPQEWAMESGMWISDPRGWRGEDFEKPISFDEYHIRFLESGVVPYSPEFGLLGDVPPVTETPPRVRRGRPPLVAPAPAALPSLPTQVWAAYYSDLSGLILWDNELDALRYAVGKGMKVSVVEFGVDLTEALK